MKQRAEKNWQRSPLYRFQQLGQQEWLTIGQLREAIDIAICKDIDISDVSQYDMAYNLDKNLAELCYKYAQIGDLLPP